MRPSAHHSTTASVVYRQYPSRNAAEPISAVRVPVNTKATSGLVLYLAADCNDMGCAHRVERILHALGDTGIIAEQDAREKRGLRFRHAMRLRDDVLGVRFECTPRKRGEPC